VGGIFQTSAHSHREDSDLTEKLNGVTDAGAIDGDQEHSSASEEVYRVPREMGILKVLPCNAEDSCGGTHSLFVCIAQCAVSRGEAP
jgi:hypothetical protein